VLPAVEPVNYSPYQEKCKIGGTGVSLFHGRDAVEGVFHVDGILLVGKKDELFELS